MIAALFAPWRTTRTLWTFVFCVLSLAVGSVSFTVIVSMFATAFSIILLFPFALVIFWLTFFVSRAGGYLERSRISSLLGVDLVDPVPPLTRSNWFYRQLERFTSLARWKELAYLVLLLPLGILTSTVVLSAWVLGLVLLTLPLYVGSLPLGTARLLANWTIAPGPGAWVFSLGGLIVVAIVAPWLTTAMGGLSVTIGRWLLGRDREKDLEHAVEALEFSRSAAVDSAETERRRIERDLHDGAQQRLVALAIDLGVAREKADLSVEEAKAVISKSHEEVKAAMKDLRDLVRGIHPVVLEDRGLDAALSAIVARSAIPIDLKVSVAGRLSPATESAAYFIVSESLANIARHSEATKATVAVQRRGERLIIDIGDNGVGGADAARGTGLHGLSVRVSGLSGWMTVVSPVGGPTSIIAELPCG